MNENVTPAIESADPIKVKLAEVATALGADWSFEPNDHERRRWGGPGRLVHRCGAEVHVESYEGKLKFRGLFSGRLNAPWEPSRWEGGRYIPGNAESFSCGIGEGKPAARIAKELQRRVLDTYVTAWARARAVLDKTERAERAQKVACDALRAAFPFDPPINRHHGDSDNHLHASLVTPDVTVKVGHGGEGAEVVAKFNVTLPSTVDRSLGDAPEVLASLVGALLDRIGLARRTEAQNALDALTYRGVWWEGRKALRDGARIEVHHEALPHRDSELERDEPGRLEVVFIHEHVAEDGEQVETHARAASYDTSHPAKLTEVSTLKQAVAAARALYTPEPEEVEVQA